MLKEVFETEHSMNLLTETEDRKEAEKTTTRLKSSSQFHVVHVGVAVVTVAHHVPKPGLPGHVCKILSAPHDHNSHTMANKCAMAYVFAFVYV